MSVTGNGSPPARSADRFHLRGPSVPLDPRVHAYRRDIAEVALAGTLFAPHYARPEQRGCVAATAPIRKAPAGGSEAVSELIRGEAFAIVDLAGGWAWGYSLHDHYVGYVDAAALGMTTEATHIVSVPAALVFAEADIKSPVVERLPFGARIAAQPDRGFVAAEWGFLHERHVAPADARFPDPVALAETLVGSPYRWGGRSGDGLDCSGLVQMVHALCGTPLPRDSDQQAATAGRALAEDEPLARGDLVFFPGHVGLMADGAHMVHANAHWMAVVVEPLADVVARGATITARRRP